MTPGTHTAQVISPSAEFPRTPYPRRDASPRHNPTARVAYARRNPTPSLQDGEELGTHARVSTQQLVKFIRSWALRYSIKDLARLTGLSEQGVKNLRTGEAGASGQTISTWCLNDPHFRIGYFRWCGGHLETSPKLVLAISMALTSLANNHDEECSNGR